VRQLFQTRSKIISAIRAQLDQLGFLEVETPMMQPLAGGAVAKPFKTYYEALNTEMYLRIAPELYLKRLLVGGFEKVYEINRSFRNEGLSRRHNPEFTMIEIYAAYQDYQDMMTLTENIIASAAQKVLGKTIVEIGEQKIELAPPWKRMTIHQAIESVTGVDFKSVPSVAQAAKEMGVEFEAGSTNDQIVNEVFEAKVESKLIQPTFITDYPSSLCPLAKTKKEDPSIAERFELFICGQELANAYSELNDPEIQLENFKKQVEGQKDKSVDKDYVRALEFGMPPAGGLGIGIDRLVMLLTASENIREVILFPQLKPEGAEHV
jgi:lysyl-tRNA synthetase class 2